MMTARPPPLHTTAPKLDVRLLDGSSAPSWRSLRLLGCLVAGATEQLSNLRLRQPHREHCSPLRVRDYDPAAVGVDYAGDDRQSGAGVAGLAARGVGAVGEEAVEDAREIGVGDARALIGDARGHDGAFDGDADRDRASLRREARGD